MEKYFFIGYCLASGKLDNGNPWNGYRIALGVYGREGNIMKVEVAKAPATDSIRAQLEELPNYIDVKCLFDINGKVATIDLAAD